MNENKPEIITMKYVSPRSRNASEDFVHMRNRAVRELEKQHLEVVNLIRNSQSEEMMKHVLDEYKIKLEHLTDPSFLHQFNSKKQTKLRLNEKRKQGHLQDEHYPVNPVKKPVYKKVKTSLYKTPVKTVRNSDVSSVDFLKSYEWRTLRMEAIKLHGAECQCCGASRKTGAIINVDHIKPRKLFPELALDITNLQVLCEDCNHGKGNWDQTDWRDKTSDEETDSSNTGQTTDLSNQTRNAADE